MRKMAILMLCAAAALPAQTAANDGFVATAYRTLSVPPTHALVNAIVTSEKPLDDILNKVKELELTIEHLRTVATTPGFDSPIPGASIPSRTSYLFTREVPLSQSTAVMDRIRAFGRSNALEYPTLAQMGGVKATDAALLAAQRDAFGFLYREAKSRAEAMAREAGLSGKVLAAIDTYGSSGYFAAVYSVLQVPMAVSVRIAVE